MKNTYNFCACGCKQRVTKFKNKYINGHNQRGKYLSLNTRSKMKRAQADRILPAETIKKFSTDKLGKNNPNWKKHPSEETLKLMSEAQKGEKNHNFGKPGPAKGGRGKGGKREDLGNQYFRSSWEPNIARVFNWEGIPFEYEHKRFILVRSDKLKATYCLDFHITGTNIWYEVKGYMDKLSAEKIQLFKEQYPDEILIVIGLEKYRALKETYKYLISNWE
jgi:hypothetical protein